MTPLPEPGALRDPRTGNGIYFTENQMKAYGKAEYERGLNKNMEQTKHKPLADDEIGNAIRSYKTTENLMGMNHLHVARAIEQAHGIKETS